MVCKMCKNVAHGPHSEGDDRRSLLRQAVCHKWGLPGIDAGPHTVQRWMMGLKAPSLSLLMTLKQVLRWTCQKGEPSYRDTWTGWEEWAGKNCVKFNKVQGPTPETT